jgi:hypothetical protein
MMVSLSNCAVPGMDVIYYRKDLQSEDQLVSGLVLLI